MFVFIVGGTLQNIHSKDIKKERWIVYEVGSHISHEGSGPPFPPPVYVPDQAKPSAGLSFYL